MQTITDEELSRTIDHEVSRACHALEKDHQAALAEKDREIARERLNKHQFERDWLEVCDQVFNQIKEYNDLMAQAVSMAKLLMTSDDEFETYVAGEEFLKLPTVQAWRAQGDTARKARTP